MWELSWLDVICMKSTTTFVLKLSNVIFLRLEVVVHFIVYIAYGQTDGVLFLLFCLLLAADSLSFHDCLPHYIFNPSGFEWQKQVSQQLGFTVVAAIFKFSRIDSKMSFEYNQYKSASVLLPQVTILQLYFFGLMNWIVEDFDDWTS